MRKVEIHLEPGPFVKGKVVIDGVDVSSRVQAVRLFSSVTEQKTVLELQVIPDEITVTGDVDAKKVLGDLPDA